MGIRILLAVDDPIAFALRRFRRLLERNGMTWEQRRRTSFIKPTQIRRAKRFKKRFKTRQATYLAQKAGKQPMASLEDALGTLWRRTGKP